MCATPDRHCGHEQRVRCCAHDLADQRYAAQLSQRSNGLRVAAERHGMAWHGMAWHGCAHRLVSRDDDGAGPHMLS